MPNELVQRRTVRRWLLEVMGYLAGKLIWIAIVFIVFLVGAKLFGVFNFYGR